jgi:hypothetical protein
VRDFSDADVGIGEQRFGDLDIVVGGFWQTTSGATCAPSGGKPRLGALPNQAALEFCQRAKPVNNEPPLRGRRVKDFGQDAKPDTPVKGRSGFEA